MCPPSLLGYNKLQCWTRLCLNSQLHYCKHAHLQLCMDVDEHCEGVCCRVVQSLLPHRWSCQCLEVMPAWHVVIDWTGLGLYAAETKAHSGWDNGELTAWVAFITLPLSPSLPPVYCVCCLTVSLVLSRSLKAWGTCSPSSLFIAFGE